MSSRRSSKRPRLWPRPSNSIKFKTAGFHARRFSGNAMKLNIPEIKIPNIKIPEVKMPKVKLPKGGLPKVNIPKLRRKDEYDGSAADEELAAFDDEPAADDISDEPEYAVEFESEAETETEPAPKSHEKVKGYGMVISEEQLRMVWAGEIGFSLLIVFASILIAIAN